MKRIFVAGILACFSAAVFSQMAEKSADSRLTLTIEDAVKIAMQNNVSIKQSKINLDKLEDAANFSWNSMSPSVSASGSYSTGFKENSESVSVSGGASLALSSNLFASMRAARLNYENGLISYEASLRSIELSVRKTFYGLLYEKENIELQKRGLETSRIQYETNREKFRNGKISELDVMTSRVAYEQKKPSVESAEITYENDLSSFKQILGLDQDTVVELSGSLSELLNMKAISFESLPKSVQPAPNVQSAQKSLEIAENTLLSTRFSAYGPSITANFNYVLSRAPLTENSKWTDSKSLSVGVKIPLDGYLPWSQTAVSVRTNKKSVQAAELSLESARTSVAVDTQNYIRQINQGISQIESLRENEKLAEETYNMSLTAYNYGKTDILSLQNYSDSLLSARVSVKKQAYSLISSVLNLESLLGLEFGTLAR